MARAEELLGRSVEAIATAGQSVILVSALEALAGVLSAQGHPTVTCNGRWHGFWAPRPSPPPTARAST